MKSPLCYHWTLYRLKFSILCQQRLERDGWNHGARWSTVVPGRWCQQGLADMVVLNESSRSTQQSCWHSANAAVHKWLWHQYPGEAAMPGRQTFASIGNKSNVWQMPYGTWLSWSKSTCEWFFRWGFYTGLEMAWRVADKGQKNWILLPWPIYIKKTML